ncbi:MAG TPA: pyridoxamine 5'-phosphate oxidase [Stellaceae bacterium]|jgi:pyridoxamine 5'-phosphate oxidase|nr:pyridoxamine 5'-phosphate oxidase [Stellaceae bacterium]
MSLDDATDPIALFDAWFAEARASEINDPSAMQLATATKDGVPSVRTVLLKGHGPAGFVFYTNLESRKGVEALSNPQAALCFHWKSLRKQVRIEGAVEQISAAEADAYYDSRPRDSRIGAWASIQSRPMEGRHVLEGRFAEVEARFGNGVVPRPNFWSGLRVVPQRMEFWQDRRARLHDRILFERPPVMAQSEAGGNWLRSWLFP